MIGRYVLAALVAGLIAGAVLTGLQVWKLSPLIAAAEVFEKADGACVETMPGMKMCADYGAKEWEPAPGLPRIGFTGAASLLAGGGFALLLAGISLVANLPLAKANGWVWGLCGFFAVHLAPSFGLAPELPGMPVADLAARQIWWLGTIISTAAGIYCFASNKTPWIIGLGAVFILLPHLIGAPLAAQTASTVPPELAAEFAAKALACAAVFWLVMGTALGQLLPPLSEKLES